MCIRDSYQAYTDYEGMMELTESMFRYLAEKVCGSAVISYNGTVIDMEKPFRRMTMIDAIKEYAGVDFSTVTSDEEAKALADQHHVEYEARHKRGDIINPVSYTHLGFCDTILILENRLEKP